MPKFEMVPGGRTQSEVDNYAKLVADFKSKFETILKDRGVFNDFSLPKIVEEVSDGKILFEGHEKEIFDKIQDLFEMPLKPNESNIFAEDKDGEDRMAA